MVNKVLRDLLAVFLCFCVICSLCGVTFADAGESPPVVDVPEEPVPDPTMEPVPDPTVEPIPDPTEDPVVEPTEEPTDPVVDPTDEPVVVPSEPPTISTEPGITINEENNWIKLPEDYVIKSAGLEDLYAIDPQSAVGPITSANTTGLKSVLLSILGSYDPIIAEYQYLNNNSSYYSYLREVQPDYVWLSSAAIFAILLYSTWRILGGLACRQW